MKPTPTTVSLCVSITLFVLAIVFCIVYFVNVELESSDNKFGEVGLFMFAVSFLSCIIHSNIKNDDESSVIRSTRVSPTSVGPTNVGPTSVGPTNVGPTSVGPTNVAQIYT